MNNNNNNPANNNPADDNPADDNSAPARPRAELKTAFWWYCDSCGAENFERALLPELSNDDMLAVMAAHNVEPGAASFFCIVPEWVSCKSCGVAYEAIQEFC